MFLRCAPICQINTIFSNSKKFILNIFVTRPVRHTARECNLIINHLTFFIKSVKKHCNWGGGHLYSIFVFCTIELIQIDYLHGVLYGLEHKYADYRAYYGFEAQLPKDETYCGMEIPYFL